MSGQTHEFIIYGMRQRARADNLTICYHKKQTDICFLCVCPITDNEFSHNIVKVAVDPRGDIAEWIHRQHRQCYDEIHRQ